LYRAKNSNSVRLWDGLRQRSSTLEYRHRRKFFAEAFLYCLRASLKTGWSSWRQSSVCSGPASLLFEQASTATTKRHLARLSNGKASCGSLRCKLPILVCDESGGTCGIGLLSQLSKATSETAQLLLESTPIHVQLQGNCPLVHPLPAAHRNDNNTAPSGARVFQSRIHRRILSQPHLLPLHSGREGPSRTATCGLNESQTFRRQVEAGYLAWLLLSHPRYVCFSPHLRWRRCLLHSAPPVASPDAPGGHACASDDSVLGMLSRRKRGTE
jgi:hypothetical protein